MDIVNDHNRGPKTEAARPQLTADNSPQNLNSLEALKTLKLPSRNEALQEKSAYTELRQTNSVGDNELQSPQGLLATCSHYGKMAIDTGMAIAAFGPVGAVGIGYFEWSYSVNPVRVAIDAVNSQQANLRSWDTMYLMLAVLGGSLIVGGITYAAGAALKHSAEGVENIISKMR